MGRTVRLAVPLAVLALLAVGPGPSGLSSEAPVASAAPVAAGPPRVGLPGSTTVVATRAVHQGRPRPFVLHVPDGLLGPAPLVLALHAYTEDAARIRGYSGLERLAAVEGFVVAFPEGVNGSWNAGGCCGPARDGAVDDVAYLDAVLEAVRARVAVDPARIGVTGFSNGAMMALRWACERSSTVAAAAVVAGTVVADCAPDARVAVLDLHGDADLTVPLGGGPVPRLGAVFPPVRAALAPFAAAAGEVEVVRTPAGHTWPSLARHGVQAERAVWEWLRDHPRTG